jgi:NodT family efflux transporter outer membrane factor (OMF) lipoprotein
MTPRARLVATALLASCAPPAATVQVRKVELPPTFVGAASGGSIADVDWARFFADDKLEALIGEALDHNFDVQIALQRIEIARAGILQVSGARLPVVSAALGGSVEKFGRYTMDGAGNATTQITPGRTVPTYLPDLFVGLEATWEPDLWGRLSGIQGAARARYLASIEGTNLVISNLVANIAVAYYELVALDLTQEVLTETITRQTQALEMMRVQKQAGFTNELAVRQFEAQLASTRAMSATTRAQTREVENDINVLLGRAPQPITRNDAVLQQEVAPTLATGVPSDLVRNRPDLRAAELQIQATRFDLGAARAAFYPHLSISARLGYEAFDPRFLFRTPASIALGIVGSLVAPIVNRRGIEAAFKVATAAQLEAMYAYESVVLRSFADVATGLYTLEQASEIVAQERIKQQALETSVDAANELFRAGKATYLEVLLAEQKTLEAELDLITAMRDQHLTKIRLYKALGGGWRGVLRDGANARSPRS